MVITSFVARSLPTASHHWGLMESHSHPRIPAWQTSCFPPLYPTWSHLHVSCSINSSLLSYLWIPLLIWGGEGRVMRKRGEPNIYRAISMFQALC